MTTPTYPTMTDGEFDRLTDHLINSLVPDALPVTDRPSLHHGADEWDVDLNRRVIDLLTSLAKFVNEYDGDWAYLAGLAAQFAEPRPAHGLPDLT